MPETISPLIAILLVTQSSKGLNDVAFRWPPVPSVRTRLSRPRPDSAEPDGSWRAAHYDIDNGYDAKLVPDSSEDTDDYEWHRSGVQRPRRSSVTFPNSPPRTSRGPAPRTPNHSQNSHHPSPAPEANMDRDAYAKLLGYRAAFLADILSPKRSLCHQKFELVVDELAFLGHPVHAGPDGGWGWEELYRSRATSVVERGPGWPEKGNNERGLGLDRVIDQGAPYVQRSGSFAEHTGLFADRPELSESSASLSSSALSLGTPRPFQSQVSLGEARGRMPTRPPFDLRMSSSDHMPSPSPAVTPSSSATPISGASSESSTVAHMPNTHRPLPHVPSHSNSTSHPDSDADSAPQIMSFHLVLVLDRLDPRSVSARDLHKYNDVFYQQIAFKMTAVMHYEQGRSGWVARASDKLIALREECVEKELPFFDYCDRAVSVSPLAAAIRNVFECVTRGAVAHIQINDVPLDIQLPPHHASMLGGGASTPEDGVDPDADLEQGHPNTNGDDEFEDETGRAEDARRFGWWLPRLLPWKGLLLLEDAGPGTGAKMIVRMHSGRVGGGSANGTAADEEGLADEDMFRKFLTNVHPSVSLADIAELSELNLKMDVYPMARLLLYNRKARIVDVIPSGMKVLYTAAPAFKRPLPELSVAFSRLFPAVPPLPSLLSTLTSSSQPFSSLIPSRDHREFYLEILVWLLRHYLIDKLHLRVRIVATPEVRAAARAALARERENTQLGREMAQVVGTARREKRQRRKKRRKSKASDELEVYFRPDSGSVGGEVFEPSSPEYAVRRPSYGHPHGSSRRRRSSRSSMSSERLSRIPENLAVSVSEEALEEEEEDWDEDEEDEDEAGVDGDGEGGDALWEEDASIGDVGSVVIAEPAEATQLEMRWMDVMAEGKDPVVAQKFHRLRKYFDGKVTADEILYREDITRRELREVIHHFDTYLIQFLHP